MNQVKRIKDRQMNYLNTARINKTLAVVTLSTLAACGGGGGGGGSPSAPTTISGFVLDGYISGAKVCLDSNSNGTCDSTEPTATTATNGSYSFSVPAGTSLSNLNIVAQVPVGATDSDHPGTTVTTAYTLLAPASQPLVVTPLTTLVSQYLAITPSLSAQTAATQVVSALGLPPGSNLFQDYVSGSGASASLHNVAQVVNAVIQNASLSTTPTQASLNAAVAVAATYVPAAIATNASISTILATATAATIDNQALLTQFNAIRQNAGAGTLVQNSLLYTAAAKHANYLVNNNLVANATYLNSYPVTGILGGHYEDTTKTGFTGASPSARATASGYAGASSVNELLSFGSSSAAECSASIENSVYHLIALISPFLDIGLSYNTGNGAGSVCGIELGIAATSGQYPAVGSWAFYPGNAQSGVPPTFYNQAESPVPASDLSLTGHPVIMSLYNQSNTTLIASDIVLSSFTLTPTAGGSPVAARVLTQSGVTTSGTTITPDSNISAPGFLVLLPTSPLSANTTYTVNFSATIKGTATVSKSWTFTTGNMN